MLDINNNFFQINFGIAGRMYLHTMLFASSKFNWKHKIIPCINFGYDGMYLHTHTKPFLLDKN